MNNLLQNLTALPSTQLEQLAGVFVTAMGSAIYSTKLIVNRFRGHELTMKDKEIDGLHRDLEMSRGMYNASAAQNEFSARISHAASGLAQALTSDIREEHDRRAAVEAENRQLREELARNTFKGFLAKRLGKEAA